MRLIKLAGATLNLTPLDWEGNLRSIRRAIDEARADDVTLLCLPEMCLTGYGCEDAFLSPNTVRRAFAGLRKALPWSEGMIVTFGMPLFYRRALYNVTCLAVDGQATGFVAKQFLPGDGVHYEPRWFKVWPRGKRVDFDLDGTAVPLGDIFFDCGGIRIGIEICEDAWVADRPGRDLALEAVDIILNPSASHFAFGKRDVRQRYVVESSRAFGVSYVYSNLVGNEAGRLIYDGGALISHDGRLVAAGPRFSFDDVSFASAVVDVSADRLSQVRSSSFEPQFDAEPVAVPFAYPEASCR